MPDCPIPLLWRDMLCKMNAQITFSPEKWLLCLEIMPESALRFHQSLEEEEDKTEPILEQIKEKVSTAVGANEVPGHARFATPVSITLQDGVKCPRKKHYPLKREATQGIQPVLTRFLEHGLIRPCRSPCNTPKLPVKKPHTNEYWLVQDLRAVNEILEDIHPTVPNTYTLFTNIPGDYEYSTLPDLKDAFFCIPVEEESQLLFALEW